MATEMGELVVGAHLELIQGCDVISYNVRPPVGQHEFDVLGMRFGDSTAFLCEVATHLDGLHYGGGNKDTLETIKKKHRWQRDYARTCRISD